MKNDVGTHVKASCVLKVALLSLLAAMCSFLLVAIGLASFKVLASIAVCVGAVAILIGGVAHAVGSLEDDVTGA
jgi:hypothetical protein